MSTLEIKITFLTISRVKFQNGHPPRKQADIKKYWELFSVEDTHLHAIGLRRSSAVYAPTLIKVNIVKKNHERAQSEFQRENKYQKVFKTRLKDGEGEKPSPGDCSQKCIKFPK